MKNLLLSIVSMFFLISLIGSVYALNLNTFNNSLTNENLTFAGNENITRYLAIPSTVSVLTNGFLNISGYESSSYPTQTFLQIGNSNVWSFLNTTSETIQGQTNWQGGSGSTQREGIKIETHDFPVTLRNFSLVADILVTKPTKYYIGNTTAGNEIGSGDLTSALNLPTTYALLPNTIYYITVDKNGGGFDRYYIYNNSGIMINGTFASIIGGTGQGIGGDEASYVPMFQNVTLEGSSPFNSTNVKIDNLSGTINSYLNSTYLVGSNYIIPFIFHSDTAGTLEYSDLNFNNNGLNLSSVLVSPSDSAEYQYLSLINFTVSASSLGNLTNATLYIWDSLNSIILKNTQIININPSVKGWSSSSLTVESYKWNVLVCGDDLCTFASQNRTFTVTPPPPAYLSEPIYLTLNNFGAGLGIFFGFISQALPLLMFGLVLVVITVAIAYAIFKSIKLWHHTK